MHCGRARSDTANSLIYLLMLFSSTGRKDYLCESCHFTLLGASHPDEIIGKNVLDFIHPEFRDVVRKNIEKDLWRKITTIRIAYGSY